MGDLILMNKAGGLTYDGPLTISTAASRMSRKWQQQNITWGTFLARLSNPVRSTVTVDQFLNWTKAQQDEEKDVGGYVFGSIEGTRRQKKAILQRCALVYDLDNIPAGGAGVIIDTLAAAPCGAVVHSTRKHQPHKPRLRIIIRLAAAVPAEHYEPLARFTADKLGIMPFADPTTFQSSRLMFWPSVCSDGEYVFRFWDRPPLDGAALLGQIPGWDDAVNWPKAPAEDTIIRRDIARQADPLDKKGIVGAFCRSYTVQDAIGKFLDGVYTPTDRADRFTFAGGSTTGGLVIYDDRFAYSHHATDPCSQKLCNAFDLVRIHLFGEQDGGLKEDTPEEKCPSFDSMARWAEKLEPVAAVLGKEREEHNRELFGAEIDEANWEDALEKKQGSTEIKATVWNVSLVLRFDPLFRGRIALDEFAERIIIRDALPWDRLSEGRQWTDNDDTQLLRWFENIHKMANKNKMMEGLTAAAYDCRFNAVGEYLGGLIWDGIPRVSRIFTDYLGADDSEYTRQVAAAWMVGACGRAVKGATKFDYVPILTGPQGIGKSTLIEKLGRGWYLALNTFDGKDAMENLVGKWLVEIGELHAFNKAEMTVVKGFISKRFDSFRAPYGRRTEDHPRRCVFIGTTNEAEYLRDTTGNRRFLPIECAGGHKSVFDDLTEKTVDQIWAEAYTMWKNGAPTELEGEACREAEKRQALHEVKDVWEGMIQTHLDTPRPADSLWREYDLETRRGFYDGTYKPDVELAPATVTSVLEIWCECLGRDKAQLTRIDSCRIANILKRLQGWSKGTYGSRRGYAGRQISYVRL